MSENYFCNYLTMNPLDQELYRLFADKTLGFGCVVNANKWVTKQLPLIWTSCIIWVVSDEWEIDIINTYLKPYKDHSWSFYNDSLEWFMSTYTILWHEPQLHDVFRVVAEQLGIVCELAISSFSDDYKLMFSKWPDTVESFYYNPTLPLLLQSDTTKSALIDLFC
jgi:hypothetical protein